MSNLAQFSFVSMGGLALQENFSFTHRVLFLQFLFGT